MPFIYIKNHYIYLYLVWSFTGKLKRLKKKKEAINSSIVEYVFFFNKSLSRVSSAYDHNVWHENTWQEDNKTKTERVRSQSSRRSRAAAIHNQSEQVRNNPK